MPWSKLILRLGAVTIAMILIWRVVVVLPGYTGVYDPARHLLLGAIISGAVLAVVFLALRLDHLPWRTIGHHAAGANLRAFALGAGLWLLPAVLGTALCIGLGWSAITLQSTPAAVLAALPALALGVFLVEAFPEELVVRGYLQGLVAQRAAQWVALLVQMALFAIFAWAVGALDTVQQWMFVPGFGLVLGIVRALAGNVWASMGVHFAWMTTTQLLNGHAAVEGLQTLLFVAFTLDPMMSSVWYDPAANPNARRGPIGRLVAQFDRFFTHVAGGYRGLLRWCLKHRKTTLAAAFAAFVGSFLLFPLVGVEFVPPADTGEFQVDIETPLGSSVDYTASKVRQIDATLQALPEVEGTYATINAGTTSGDHRAAIVVSMVPAEERDRTPQEMTEPVRDVLQQIPGATYQVGAAGGLGGVAAPVSITLYGDNFTVLEGAAGQLQAGLSEIEGLIDIESSLDDAQPVLGVRIDRDLATQRPEFRAGPVFADLLLADEINRAPAKTQAALLEAMQERQVTVDGVSRPLPAVFTVFATQNPVEHEGTYPLPEAQLDRFLLKIDMHYPSAEAERGVLDRYVDGFRADDAATYGMGAPVTRAELESLRAATGSVHVEGAVRDYIVAIIRATREDAAFTLPASPRASVALFSAARAHAVLEGRDFVVPDDVKELAVPVLRHRVRLTAEAEVEGQSTDRHITLLLDAVEETL